MNLSVSVFSAIKTNNLTRLDQLLEISPDLFEFSPDGQRLNTPLENNTLHAAAGKLTTDLVIIKALLNHAKHYGQEYFNKYLNSQNSKGETALYLAARSGGWDSEIVQLLLSFKDIDLNLADEDSDTPLHVSIYNDSNDISVLLINAGARFDIANNEGETALDLSKTADKYIHQLMKSKMEHAKAEHAATVMDITKGLRERRGKTTLPRTKPTPLTTLTRFHPYARTKKKKKEKEKKKKKEKAKATKKKKEKATKKKVTKTKTK